MYIFQFIINMCMLPLEQHSYIVFVYTTVEHMRFMHAKWILPLFYFYYYNYKNICANKNNRGKNLFDNETG